MSRVKTLQSLFKRYRRPGDIVFAWLILMVALLLLSQLFEQTSYRAGTALFAQPRFWPAVALLGMSAFAALHLFGSFLSDRIDGRWQEILLWLSAFEYATWFIVYALMVPVGGYLLMTVLFAVLLSLRAGYRSTRVLAAAVVAAVLIVVLFKSLMKVNLPSGQLYEVFPEGLRQFMLTYF